MSKDWTGNRTSVHATLGAHNIAAEERETHDYYATEPKAAHLLMDVEKFSPLVWECACGEGHLAREFEAAGYHVYASDLINRGYGYQQDFLTTVAPPLARFRHNHKPALFKGRGVRGPRAGDHRPRPQSSNVSQDTIP